MQVVESYPYEQLSHAVLAWADENIAKCDVIHAHEWGGVFMDLATVANYRQLKPGAPVAPYFGKFACQLVASWDTYSGLGQSLYHLQSLCDGHICCSCSR